MCIYNSTVIYFYYNYKKVNKKSDFEIYILFYKYNYYIYKNKIVKGYYNILLELLSGNLSFEY